MNTQNRPEATTHGGWRRFRIQHGHSSIVVSSVALAFCLTLLAFSVISIIAPAKKAYANGNIRKPPIITLTIPITVVITPTNTPTPTPTVGITPTDTPIPTPGITPTDTPIPTATPIPTSTTPPTPGKTPPAQATPTNTPSGAGAGVPPPAVTPTQNPGLGTPTPPSNGGTSPGTGPATPVPTSASSDQVNSNGNGNIAAAATGSDSTGMIVGASAGLILLLIIAGIGGWMLYNKRIDQQAKSSIYASPVPLLQPEQANWNAFQANAAFEGVSHNSPTLMQPSPSFGMQGEVPMTPPPNYNNYNQSAMEQPGHYNHPTPSTPMTPPGGYDMPPVTPQPGYAANHNEYATVQSYIPLEEQLAPVPDIGYHTESMQEHSGQALLAEEYAQPMQLTQPPDTPSPNSSTDAYLDAMLHQAQVGLFVLPGKETK